MLIMSNFVDLVAYIGDDEWASSAVWKEELEIHLMH